MLQKITLLAAVSFIGIAAKAQLNVGSSSAPVSSSMLTVTSGGGKGFLGPQVALTGTGDITTIVNPALGLMVYNTATAGSGASAVTAGYYSFVGGIWVSMTAATANIYNSDGTLTSNRTLTQGANNINVLATSGTFNVTGNTNGLMRTFFSNNNSGAANRSDVGVRSNGNSTYLGVDNSGNIFGAGTKAYFDNWTGGRSAFGINGGEFMTLATNGYVGIGINAPSSRLSVVSDGGDGGSTDDIELSSFGSVTSPAIVMKSSGGSVASPASITNGITLGSFKWQGMLSGGNTTLSAIEANYQGNGITNLSNMNFQTSGIQHMTIDQAGNVGIGTGTPKYMLDVNGTGLFRNGNSSSITSSLLSQLVFGYSNLPQYQHAIKTRHNNTAKPGNSIDFFVWDQGTDVVGTIGTKQVMTLDGYGNVGIGTMAPSGSYMLDVNGLIRTTGAVSTTSDVRLKNNITPVTNALSSIMQLIPVSYNKKSSIASTDFNYKEFGFIAQDIRKVFPTLVVEDKEGDKLLSIKYQELIPVLTKAIQEQQVQLLVKDTRIADLEIRIAAIEKAIEKNKDKY